MVYVKTLSKYKLSLLLQCEAGCGYKIMQTMGSLFLSYLSVYEILLIYQRMTWIHI